MYGDRLLSSCVEPAKQLLRTATVAAIASAALVACSSGPERPAPDQPTASATPLGTSPDPRTHHEPAIGTVASFQELMATDAPLNVIYIDTKSSAAKAENKKDYYYSETEKINRKLKSGDKGTLNLLKDSLTFATAGRYTPRAVSVSRAAPINTGKCINVDKSLTDEAQIQQAAFEEVKPGSLNIAIVNVSGCGDINRVGGYAPADGIPVLLRTGIAEQYLTSDAVHETGHAGGLDHAAAATCTDRVRLLGCKVAATADADSVMSYVFDSEDAHKYSVPEMWRLGLLKKSEIVTNPPPGTYTVAGMGQKGIKLLDIATPKGIINVSSEKDTAAAYDQACVPTSEASFIPYGDVLAVGDSYGKDGRDREWTLYKKNPSSATRSLQIRLEKPDGQLILVPRNQPDDTVCPDAFTQMNNIEKPSVVYEGLTTDKHQTRVTYLGQKDGLARVKIQTIK